ncbi:MAG: Ig-like domain-containing protein [Lachnospiraceae bacterium]|nr:Ig-like domain-containing protein [Lachnospiraceae bacterium]MDD3615980.1 Ig-like domain-containing protein [Lachnospiraceae bacterium]
MKIRREQLLALTLSVVLGVSSTVTAVPVFAEDGNAGAVTQMEVAQESQKAGNVNQPTAGTVKSETKKTETAKTETAKTEDTKAENIKDENANTEVSDNQNSQENKKQDEKTEDTYKNNKTDIADGEKNQDAVQQSNNTETSGVVAVQGLSQDELVPMAEMKTYSIVTKTTPVEKPTEVSAMYSMDSVVVTMQEDGSYLVRMHQTDHNRNYMAFTSESEIAAEHEVDWYKGSGSDGCYFTVPIDTLDEPIIACFSSDERIAIKKFSRAMNIAFDKDSMKETTTESPAVASDIKILPKTVKVSSVSLDETAVSLKEGDTKTLIAIVNPEDATDKTVIWSSDKEAVATVANGVITAVKAGEAIITATVGDKTATCSVTVTDNSGVTDEAKKEILRVTNTTGMFKVVSAAVETKDNQSVLRFSLNSTGYENLFIGTYDEACATTADGTPDETNWVHYALNDAGKYEFVIPLAEGQTFIPVQALSKNYANKGEYRWYSRQMVVDRANKTLTAGDYDKAETIALTNNTTLPAASAELETVGGPMSNNYNEILKLAMSDTTFDKIYIGSAEDAKTAENTVAIDGQLFNVSVKTNNTGGTIAYDYLDKKTVFAFHSAAEDTWTEAEITVSKTGSSVLMDTVPVAATGISLDQNTLTLEKGAKGTLKATVTPEDATDKTVTWTSDNEAIAKVDTKGTVTAVADGTTTITAAIGSYSAECVVTVETTEIKFSVQTLVAKGTAKATVNSDNVVLTLTDEDEKSYDIPKISSNKYSFTKLDADKTYTLTVSREDYEVVTETKNPDSTDYIHTSTGETIFTKTITKADAGSAFTIIFQRVEDPLRDALRAVPEDEADYDMFTTETAQKLKEAVAAADAAETDATKREAMAKAITDAINGLVLKSGTYDASVETTSGFPIPDFVVTSKNGEMSVQITANGFAFTKLYLGTAAEAKTAADDDPKMILPDGDMVTNSNGAQAYQFTLPLNGFEETISFASYAGGASSSKRRVWADQTATFKLKNLQLINSIVDVANVSLDETAVTMEEGDTKTLTATVTPEDATDKTVTWTSDAPDVAAVENGVITAVKAGSATITAQAENKTATCTVTVEEKAVKEILEVTNTTGMFKVVSAAIETKDGKSVLRFALNSTGYENLLIGTYDEAYATTSDGTPDETNWIHYSLNSDGKYEFVIPLTEGENFIPIQALSKNYVDKGEYRWYSRQLVIDRENKALTAGDYDKAEAITITNNTVLPAASAELETVGGPMSNNYKEILKLAMSEKTFDKVYAGSAADAKTATETTAIEDQTFNIPIKANNTGGTVDYDYLDKKTLFSFHSASDDTWLETVMTVSKDSKSVVIDFGNVAVSGISLDKTTLSLIVGDKETLTATVTPDYASDKTVIWTSDDTSIATVKDGVVTAVKAGTAKVTAKAGNQTATCTVTINDFVSVTGIKLDKSTMSLVAGKSGKLTATTAPTDATKPVVTWTSDDPTIATVDAEGNVKAIKAGQTKIWATASDGSKITTYADGNDTLTASCLVTVTAAAQTPTPGTTNKTGTTGNTNNTAAGSTSQTASSASTRTGDENNMSGWMMLMVAAGFISIADVVIRRKKKTDR